MKQSMLIFFVLESFLVFGQDNKQIIRNYNYKGYNIEIASFENIKKSNQIKYLTFLFSEEKSENYSFFLRHVPKSKTEINFNYILLFRNNKNNEKSKSLPKYKFKEIVEIDNFVNLINSFIDNEFTFETNIDFDNKLMQNKILIDSRKNIEYLCKKEYKEFVKSIYPLTLKDLDYQQMGVKYEQIYLENINYSYLEGKASIDSEVLNFNGELQCIVTWDFIVQIDGVKQKKKMTLVASSFDNGDNWYYTEIDRKNIDMYDSNGVYFDMPKFNPQLLQLLK